MPRAHYLTPCHSHYLLCLPPTYRTQGAIIALHTLHTGTGRCLQTATALPMTTRETFARCLDAPREGATENRGRHAGSRTPRMLPLTAFAFVVRSLPLSTRTIIFVSLACCAPGRTAPQTWGGRRTVHALAGCVKRQHRRLARARTASKPMHRALYSAAQRTFCIHSPFPQTFLLRGTR